MSEYQYYEWQTVDRPLTAREQSEVDGLSSHMDTVTSTQAIVTYSWGDFKHDPKQVLLKYFDAFLYDSNFGVRELMFRLPRELVEADLIEPYLSEDWITLEEHGKYAVLHIEIHDEADYFEWIESDGILGQLTPLREQLLQGDTRLLYLAWLKMISMHDREEWEDEPEPPVPAGLQKLNSSLQALAEFFEIDPPLISAAAQGSKSAGAVPEPDFESALKGLTREESDALLLKIAHGEPGAVVALKKRLTILSGGGAPAHSLSTRTVGEVLKQAQRIKVDMKRRERAEAERKRIERLEKLALEEETAWKNVENLLSQKRGSSYEEATKLLVELRDMSEYKRRGGKFEKSFRDLCKKYGKSTSLMDRFRRAKLI